MTGEEARTLNRRAAGFLAKRRGVAEICTRAQAAGRNNNWFLITLAARRALTFLERQPEVDGEELGVYGHSMGGNLTLYVAATDQRVKAGVITSAGGIEDMSDNIKNTPFKYAAYAARVTCPVLFVNPADDFHGTILGVKDTGEDHPIQGLSSDPSAIPQPSFDARVHRDGYAFGLIITSRERRRCRKLPPFRGF